MNYTLRIPMKTLILNVDRDNDFGRKAGVESPILGLEKNLIAAQKLGETDPEDSDLNAIFSAISLYKRLKTEGREVEIATICGDINVGVKSDEVLSKQLEEVIVATGVEDVILVTDGAEDEYILPIIQSRIKITSIYRVSVKQSRHLEDTYYRVLKILEDEKIQKQFVLPVALVLIVWAFFVLIGMGSSGFGAILMTLGVYLVIRVFRWEKTIYAIIHEIKSGFLTGKLSLYTGIVAAVIIIANIFLAYSNVESQPDYSFLSILRFLQDMTWGIVVAGLLIVFGRIVDIYVKDKRAPWNYWIIPFSLFAFGFISTAIFGSLYRAFLNWPDRFEIQPFFNFSFIGNITTGIMIMIVGAVTHHYIKEIYQAEKKELEIEQQIL